MQNAGIDALGLNWRYLAFEVHPDNLRGALEGARLMGFLGLNLTVPHKLLALEMLDVLDESARTWGAVNTVRFEGRDPAGNWRPLREFENLPQQMRSHGFNTDADAIPRAIREGVGVELSRARVLVLGAGGAGRTAALKLASENLAEIFLVNRTLSKATAVAEEIAMRQPGLPVRIGYPSGTVDLVVNATSLGLKTDDNLPFDEGQFALSKAGGAYDMIYRPAETPFLKLAKAAGCRAANGLGMLLYQGARALEIWSGQPPPIEEMRRALEKNVYG